MFRYGSRLRVKNKVIRDVVTLCMPMTVDRSTVPEKCGHFVLEPDATELGRRNSGILPM